MALVQVLFISARELVTRRFRGQTMVEYALIIASIGAVAWGAYNLMGHDIGYSRGFDPSAGPTRPSLYIMSIK